MDPGGERLSLVKGDRLEALAGARKAQLHVLVSDRSLRNDVEPVVERRRRKALSPNALLQRFGELEGQFTRLQHAVRFERPP